MLIDVRVQRLRTGMTGNAINAALHVKSILHCSEPEVSEQYTTHRIVAVSALRQRKPVKTFPLITLGALQLAPLSASTILADDPLASRISHAAGRNAVAQIIKLLCGKAGD